MIAAMFITFEGSEGSGKSTQMALLGEYLIQKGYLVLQTREPGGTPIGEQIREVLHNLENTAMHQRTEILLFQAARAQHVEELIKPHLEQGWIVLCDRYADSTLAYQGYGYQRELQPIQEIIRFATGGLNPHLTIFLDVEVQQGLHRRATGGEWNRLDTYQLDFYQRVRAGYLQMVNSEPERWVVIDATSSTQEVQQMIRKVVDQRLASV